MPTTTPASSNVTLAAYDSPIARVTLAALDGALVGIWAHGQRFFGHPYGVCQTEAALMPPPGSRCQGEDGGHVRAEARAGDAAALNAAALWLDDYFAGRNPTVDRVPIAPRGTDFQRRIWAAMGSIPYGTTLTYGCLAKLLREGGVPASPRAVGGAVARNPLLLILPCHRVVAAGGTGGYAAGARRKRWLLEFEAATASSSSAAQDSPRSAPSASATRASLTGSTALT